MRTLNRPMFRYGGPIKEGVMHGIREPKRNGGSMANNEGPRRAALVGNPIYPKVDGRTNHALPAVLAAPYIGAALRFAAPAFGKFVTRQIPKLNKAGKNMYKKGMPKTKRNLQTTKEEGFDPNALGKFFANDPLASKAVTGAGFTGKALQKVGGGIKYGTTTPSGLLFLGAPVTYMAGKYFLGDGTEIKGKDLNKITQGKRGTSGAPGGGDPDMYYNAPEKELTEAEKAKIESDNRIKQMDKYREIMDIKGMSKDAAYKSLIDAGKIIQEGGNLKEQLKSGKLIQNLTQAASKRFDKVGDTEAALRSLVVKGEIENELNKEDKALKRKQLRTAIAASEKAMAGDSFEKVVADYTIKNGQPTGATLTGLARVKGIPIVETIDTKILDASIKNNETVTDEVTFLQNEVQKAIQDNDPLPPGNYVIKGSIIKIDEEGNVSRAL